MSGQVSSDSKSWVSQSLILECWDGAAALKESYTMALGLLRL